MTEPSLAAQRAIATTLKAPAAITDLVPAANIFDRSGRPEKFPCIILGEGQTIDESDECIVYGEVFLDLHVWTREPGLADCKAIAGQVMRTMRGFERVQDGVNLTLVEQSARFLRDPSGDHAHGIISLTIQTDGDGD